MTPSASGAAGKPAAFDVCTAPLNGLTLLEASAGTGKTFSIKHLVLRLIVEKAVPFEKILVVTFTKAATAELSARIGQHLTQALSLAQGRLAPERADPLLIKQLSLWQQAGLASGEILERLRAAVSTLDKASISTIHGFCQKMLTENAFTAATPFETDVVPEADEIIEETIEAFLRMELDRVEPDKREQIVSSMDNWQATLKALLRSPAGLIAHRAEPGNKADPVQKQTMERFIAFAPEHVKKAKQEASLMTFDDLLVNFYEALEADKAAPAGAIFHEQIRELYSAVLVDEFQDTDPVQLKIFQTLFIDAPDYAERSLFFVGDPKQAIYSFRSADLGMYLELKNHVLHTSDPANVRIAELTTNFRSARRLIKALNALYAPGKTDGQTGIGGFFKDDLPYTCVASTDKKGLYAKTPAGDYQETPAVEFLYHAEPVQAGAFEDGIRMLAARVAQMIKAGREETLLIPCKPGEAGAVQVEEGVFARPVRPGDIAILVRSRTKNTAIAHALSAYNIRLSVSTSDDICKTAEADEFLMLLQAINNPGDDRTVRAALTTRIFGYTLLELAQPDDNREAQLREQLQWARRAWVKNGVAAAFRSLFEGRRVAERLLKTRDGEAALTNYTHLIELLHELGQRYRSPAGLIARFEKMRTEKYPDESRRPRLASDANLVTLETIHSSKGLEYPIVFVNEVSGLIGKADASTFFRVDKPGLNGGVDRELHLFVDKAQASKAHKDAGLEEAARLFYVAATRARCHLVLVHPCRRKSGKTPDDWFGVGNMVFANLMCNVFGGKKPSADVALTGVTAWKKAAPGLVATDSMENFGKAVANLVLPPVKEDKPALTVLDSSPREAAWNVRSFTAITRMIDDEGEYVNAYYGKGTTADAPAGDILSFPRGARAGDALHQMLELADFQAMAKDMDKAREDRQALVRRIMTQENLIPAAQTDALEAAVEGASQMIFDVLNAELIPGLYLRDISPTERAAEMEFLLNMPANVKAEDLGRVLEAIDPKYAVPGLNDSALKGYMTGFIDLTFGADGKFWLLDWKSNALGAITPEEFTAEAMAAEMQLHHYRLQYLLYGVALRRLLKVRLNTGDPDALIGGAIYVFLRGIRANSTPFADGTRQGIVFDPIAPGVLEALDRLFAGQSTPDAIIDEFKQRALRA